MEPNPGLALLARSSSTELHSQLSTAERTLFTWGPACLSLEPEGSLSDSQAQLHFQIGVLYVADVKGGGGGPVAYTVSENYNEALKAKDKMGPSLDVPCSAFLLEEPPYSLS